MNRARDKKGRFVSLNDCGCGLGDYIQKGQGGRYKIEVEHAILQKEVKDARERVVAFEAAHRNIYPKRKQAIKPTKSAPQVITCPSDKYTGGCSSTIYTYPNGSVRTVDSFKVAVPKAVKKKKHKVNNPDPLDVFKNFGKAKKPHNKKERQAVEWEKEYKAFAKRLTAKIKKTEQKAKEAIAKLATKKSKKQEANSIWNDYNLTGN